MCMPRKRACREWNIANSRKKRLKNDHDGQSDSTSKFDDGNEEDVVYSPFQWRDEIRLLKLYPYADGHQLRAELIHARLSNHPEYEAVSYTWATSDNDATLCREIILLPSDTLLPITKNARCALARLRNHDSTRLLWIDSVCIDQSNLPERSHQVGQMTEIYRRAHKVLVYLEPPRELASIHQLQRLFKTFEDRGLTGTLNDSKVPEVIRQDARIFLNNPWFQPMWVLQEIAMARTAVVYCGASRIDWRHIAVASTCNHCQSDSLIVDVHAPHDAELLPPVLRIRKDRTPQPTDLIDLLIATRPCGATDPRDKIYALLWCYETTSFGSIESDYKKPVADVFRETMLLCIRIGNACKLLTLTERPLQGVETWVPDFSAQSGIFYPELRNSELRWHFPRNDTKDPRGAMLKKHSDASFVSFPGTTYCGLRVQAKYEGVLVSFSRWNGTLYFELWDRIQRKDTGDFLIKKESGNSLDQAERLCERCSFQNSVLDWLVQNWGKYPSREDRNVGYSSCETWERLLRDLVQSYRYSYQLFFTQRCIGLVPSDIRANDEVYSFEGADVPFVLRRCGKAFTIVSRCILLKPCISEFCRACGHFSVCKHLESQPRSQSWVSVRQCRVCSDGGRTDSSEGAGIPREILLI